MFAFEWRAICLVLREADGVAQVSGIEGDVVADGGTGRVDGVPPLSVIRLAAIRLAVMGKLPKNLVHPTTIKRPQARKMTPIQAARANANLIGTAEMRVVVAVAGRPIVRGAETSIGIR